MAEDKLNTEIETLPYKSYLNILSGCSILMYQVRGSLARRALIELMEKGLIKQVNTIFS